MKFIFLSILIFGTITMAQTSYPEINKKINEGNFSEAKKIIADKLNSEELSEIEIYDLRFQIERMERISKDFKITEKDVLKYIKRYYPNAGDKELKLWRDDGTLEYKVIDGDVRYFNRSHANLFRVNTEARNKKNEIDGKEIGEPTAFLFKHIPDVVETAGAGKKNLVKPVKMNLNYKVTVNKDAVPEGEIIRCWLPFPREGHSRQTDIKFISANVDEYIIADNNNLQRTIYMEKESKKGEPTIFNFEVSIKNYNEIAELHPSKIGQYDKAGKIYKNYTAERLPHIAFTEKVKNLSKKIIGDETNPYKKAKIIFEWISKNVPWAGAREYSTISSISDYCLTNGYGDCGIKALTFITLCRYNGIPAKWQSGWMLYPTRLNLHDWTEIYFEGVGWVPVDPDFGLTESDNDKVKYFYLGGIDAYRWIVNDGFSKPLFPSKIFPRSETVDFQRGEVEWRGGNLYFDKWDYHLDVKYD
ncbi:MAG: transglutaminase domain-containing protein [Ignavibacteriae bacterium]|nr:transglutaminase domain-containing protein [Ignavibacteriota bacterium]NOG99929.1 transglutaminase domain-containing protein [Ignavibacteriota bacterium]